MNNNCKECNQITHNPNFCNRSCAAKFNNRNRIDKCPGKDKTKICQCIYCSKNVMINLRRSAKYAICSSCEINIQNQRICKCCGINQCSDVRCRYNVIKTLRLIGFNINSLGSLEYFKELSRIKSILISLYVDDRLSCLDIAKIYGFKNHTSVVNIFNILNISRKTLSQSNKDGFLLGKGRDFQNTKSNYKHGWHTTWDGRKIYYRSSYELDYAQQLDKQKIVYEVELLRIEYWDSRLNEYRVAIPDFYIPKENLIVEIKSNWTFDEINLKDRYKRFNELGYKFKLILDKVETELIF